jgi:beta-glucosidase
MQDTRSAPTQDSPADVRAREVEEQMTDDERFSMIISVLGAVPLIGLVRDKRIPEGTAMSAGYTPGVPRLGVPALQSSDASMGITNPGYRPDDKGATALPASIVISSSFNPELAREGGAMIGREARIRRFNAMLAGGINLARDVHNGRNFEYYSEDRLLSAVLGAEAVNDIQGEGVISTLKHNCNETSRHWLDAIIARTRTASRNCSSSRSRSSARSPAPSCAATTRSTASTPAGITTCPTRCSKALGATQAG